MTVVGVWTMPGQGCCSAALASALVGSQPPYQPERRASKRMTVRFARRFQERSCADGWCGEGKGFSAHSPPTTLTRAEAVFWGLPREIGASYVRAQLAHPHPYPPIGPGHARAGGGLGSGLARREDSFPAGGVAGLRAVLAAPPPWPFP